MTNTIADILKKLPTPKGLPFSNEEQFRCAWVLRAILIESGIYEIHGIGLTLAKLGL